MRRACTVATLCADVVIGIAVFLPWAGVTGGTATVAGWGSSVAPRLTGLFVVAAAATALAFRAGAVLVEATTRTLPQLVGTVLDAVNVILALTVVFGAGAFVGTSEPAGPRLGAWLALFGALGGLAAGVTMLAFTGEPG